MTNKTAASSNSSWMTMIMQPPESLMEHWAAWVSDSKFWNAASVAVGSTTSKAIEKRSSSTSTLTTTTMQTQQLVWLLLHRTGSYLASFSPDVYLFVGSGIVYWIYQYRRTYYPSIDNDKPSSKRRQREWSWQERFAAQSKSRNQNHTRDVVRAPQLKEYKDDSLQAFIETCQDSKQKLRPVANPDLARKEKLKAIKERQAKEKNTHFLGLTADGLQDRRAHLKRVDAPDTTTTTPPTSSSPTSIITSTPTVWDRPQNKSLETNGDSSTQQAPSLAALDDDASAKKTSKSLEANGDSSTYHAPSLAAAAHDDDDALAKEKKSEASNLDEFLMEKRRRLRPLQPLQ